MAINKILTDLDIDGVVDIATTNTDNDSTNGIDIDMTKNSTGTGYATSIKGINAEVDNSGSAQYNANNGIRTVAKHSGTGDGYFLSGSLTTATNEGSGSISGFYGRYTTMNSNGTGVQDVDYMMGNTIAMNFNNANLDVNRVGAINAQLNFNAATTINTEAYVCLLDTDFTGVTGTDVTVDGDFSYLFIKPHSAAHVPDVTGTARAINSESTLPSRFAGDMHLEGNVGIGITDPDYRLHIEDDSTAYDTSVGIKVDATKNHTNTTGWSGNVFGISASATNEGVGKMSGIYGARLYAEETGTTGAYFIIGSNNFAKHNGSGDSGAIWGSYNSASVIGTGTGTHPYLVGSQAMSTLDNSNASVGRMSGLLAELNLKNGEVTTRADGAWVTLQSTTGSATAYDANVLYLKMDDSNLTVTNKTRVIYAPSDFPSYFEGDMGIGTDDPTEKLEVDGNVLADSFKIPGGTSSEFLKADGSVDTNTYLTSADVTSSQWDAATGGINYAGGNVGIGTTSPAEELDVVGSAKVSSDIYVGNSIEHIGDSNTKVLFGSDSISLKAGGRNQLKVLKESAEDIVELNVQTTNGAVRMLNDTTTLMKIEAGGNVGIGTASPNANLHIEDSTGVTININSSSGDSMFRFQDNGVAKWFVGRDNTNQNFAFSPNGLGNGDVLTLTTTGNVGIGTTSPNGILEVQTIDTNRYIRFKAPNGEERFEFYTGGTGNPAAQYMYDADGTTRNVQIAAGGTSYFNGGSVGIGTTSPNAPLSVHNTTSTLGARVASFYHNNGTENPFIEINSLSDGMQLKAGFTTGIAGHLDILTGGGSSFITLSTNNNEVLRATASGNVGIGTDDPQAKLDVDGGIRMGNDTTAASADNEGTMRYYTDAFGSYVDMVMETDTSTYAWVNIVRNIFSV